MIINLILDYFEFFVSLKIFLSGMELARLTKMFPNLSLKKLSRRKKIVAYNYFCNKHCEFYNLQSTDDIRMRKILRNGNFVS